MIAGCSRAPGLRTRARNTGGCSRRWGSTTPSPRAARKEAERRSHASRVHNRVSHPHTEENHSKIWRRSKVRAAPQESARQDANRDDRVQRRARRTEASGKVDRIKSLPGASSPAIPKNKPRRRKPARPATPPL